MVPLCILFLHHRDDALTWRHAGLIRRHNAAAPFVPLSFGEGISGMIRFPFQQRSAHGEWGSADRLIYDWFWSDLRILAERYIVVEYDTLCLEPLRQFYDTVWDRDVAAAEVKTKENDPSWHWFQGLPYPSPYPLTGLMPLSGILLSARALAAVCKLAGNPYFNPMHSECRIGTLAVLAGFQPTIIREAADRYISWQPRIPDGPGIWHPVKELRFSEESAPGVLSR